MSKELKLLESILQKTVVGKIKWDDHNMTCFKGYSLHISYYRCQLKTFVMLNIKSSCASILYLFRGYVDFSISTDNKDESIKKKLIELSELVEENKNRIKNNKFNNMLNVFK